MFRKTFFIIFIIIKSQNVVHQLECDTENERTEPATPRPVSDTIERPNKRPRRTPRMELNYCNGEATPTSGTGVGGSSSTSSASSSGNNNNKSATTSSSSGASGVQSTSAVNSSISNSCNTSSATPGNSSSSTGNSANQKQESSSSSHQDKVAQQKITPNKVSF